MARRDSGIIGDVTLLNRYDLTGRSVSPGVGFEVLETQVRPSVTLFLLLEDLDLEL